MAEVQITTEQLEDAENFLVEFLTEQVPEANFNTGTAVRDLAIKAFTYIFAYLKGEAELIRDRQSLLRISDLTDADDIAQAADELLSNWFVTRKGGELAHVPVRLHFLAKSTITITSDTEFWRTNTLVFYVDTAVGDSYVIPEGDLLPVYDSRGVLIDYVVDLTLVAGAEGSEYNVDPGTFVRVEAPDGLPYFSYAETLATNNDGKDIETTEELVERAQTAITVRNLINNRSCDTVLQEEYPAIEETLTIGMGEAEMVRDLKTEIASHIQLHTGGYYDTYLKLPLTTVEESGTVGGLFARPDNKAVVFRDPELTYDLARTFDVDIGVKVGDAIYLRSGLSGSPRAYQVVEVRPYELLVSSAVPFSEPYDELDSPDPLVYSIGHTPPGFEDLELTTGIYVRTATVSALPTYENVPVGTSRFIREPGTIVLEGRPVQEINIVELTDPDAADGNMIDPSTGTIIFSNRVNADPIGPMTEPSLVQYRVDVLNPASAQSGDAVTVVQVGYLADLDHFDGKNLRVQYQTLSNFTAIDTFVRDRNRRVVAANHLVKARNPIWIEMRIPYKLKPTAAGTIDETEAATALATYVNNFDPNDDLDMSDMATQFRLRYEDVGVVRPFTIYYHLYAPDGQVADFATSDVVSIQIMADNGVSLENGADIVAPASLAPLTTIETEVALRSWYRYLGISDRTVRYRTTANLITFLLES